MALAAAGDGRDRGRPTAYEARLREKLRAEWEQEQVATTPAPSRPAPVFPPNLSGTRSSAPRGSVPFTGPTPLESILPN